MRIPSLFLLTASLLAASSACASLRVDKAVAVASGLTSQWICSDVFVSGIAPERAYADRVAPLRGMGLVTWALNYRVDPVRREVVTTIGGGFESRARYRDQMGCVVTRDNEQIDPLGVLPPARAPEPGPPPVVAADPRLRAALDAAFALRADGVAHGPRAVVVMQHGRVLGERYAAGVGVDTPLPGFSLTKSVVHALFGVLVRQGRIALDQPAPVPAWQDAADPRHAITVDDLLRQVSGLDLPQTNSGFDASSQIQFIDRDKAAASAAATLAAPPGTRWNYSDTNYLLLSRILRDAVGGQAGDVLRFMRSELFDPLGMDSATMEFDATGTPMGAANLFASARDWARFGQLYLDDGVHEGRRILPAGWVQHAVTPTLATGYGAGFWTNRVAGPVPGWGVPWGLPHAPADAYFGRGYMGQFVVVVPSARLVVVRLSVSHVRGDDIEETDRLVADILAALAR